MKNTENKNFVWFFVVIGIVLILGVILAITAFNKRKETQINDLNVEFSNEKVGSDFINTMENDNLLIEGSGNSISITQSGALTPAEKSRNIENLDLILTENIDDYNDFLNFDDSDPVFADEKVGSDTFRKMYSKNLQFDLRTPIISGYDFDNLSQDNLSNIGQSEKELLGTVYFDYGYANQPKTALVETKYLTLGKIDFTKVRYAETLEGLKNLLAEIPQVLFSRTIFYVDGHTDYVSPYDFNQRLSEARAECVKEILVKNFGINERNVITKGYSWDKMVIETSDECAENRRVEISVVFFN